MIDIKKINYEFVQVSDLIQFARKASACVLPGSGMLPITPWRALAQSHNPCADRQDIAMVVAWYGPEILGYLGSIPGLLRREDGDHKVHFLSTFLTSAKARRTGLGQRIISKIFEIDVDFVLTGVSVSAEGLYRKMKLTMIGNYQSCIIQIAEKNPVFRVFRKMAYVSGHRPFKRFLNRHARRIMWVLKKPSLLKAGEKDALLTTALGGKRWYRATSLSRDAVEMINSREQVDVFYKNGATMNWILSYPWVLRRGTANERIAAEYQFSSIYDEFIYYAYEIYDKKKLKGFLVFLFAAEENEGILKIIDYEMPDNLAAELCTIEAVRMQASKLILPEAVYEHLKGHRWFQHYERAKRDYFVRPSMRSKLLPTTYPAIRFQPADGDQFSVTSS